MYAVMSQVKVKGCGVMTGMECLDGEREREREREIERERERERERGIWPADETFWCKS
jgi:hypothetical protein